MPNCVRDPTQDCIGFAEAQVLKHKIEELARKQEEAQERNRMDHKEFYQRLEAGDRAQAVTQNQLAEILSDTQEIKTDLKTQTKELTSAISELQMKPAKKWDSLSEKIIWLIASAVIGAVLAYIGLGGV